MNNKMNLYKKPVLKTFSADDMRERIGPAQTAYIDLSFQQIAQLNNQPQQAIVKLVKIESHNEAIYELEKLG
jgi:ribosomal protein L35AE/L33A